MKECRFRSKVCLFGRFAGKGCLGQPEEQAGWRMDEEPLLRRPPRWNIAPHFVFNFTNSDRSFSGRLPYTSPPSSKTLVPFRDSTSFSPPRSLLSLFVPWVFLERPQLLATRGPIFLSPGVMVANSLATFALNVSVFLAIQNTSALTIRVASVVKDWLVVFISAALFADTILTPLNIVGYAIGAAPAHRLFSSSYMVDCCASGWSGVIRTPGLLAALIELFGSCCSALRRHLYHARCVLLLLLEKADSGSTWRNGQVSNVPFGG